MPGNTRNRVHREQKCRSPEAASQPQREGACKKHRDEEPGFHLSCSGKTSVRT